MKEITMDTHTLFILLSSTLRYSLPRQTYSFMLVVESIEKHINVLDTHHIISLQEDLLDYLATSNLEDADPTGCHNHDILERYDFLFYLTEYLRKREPHDKP